MSLLDVRDLTLRIGGRPLLHGLSFALEPGEVLGLVGASGSGKSLTALALMRLLPAGAVLGGTATLAGDDIVTLPEAAMCAHRGRDIALIPQEPMAALNPLHTIGDQVAEALLMHGHRPGDAMARAHANLARVGLPPDTVPPDRYPHELSGGQRQRVCIAMATAMRPKLLIADEPTTALDVTTQAAILALLRGLVTEHGMALLLITHDLAVVAGIAARVAVMAAGRIVEQGATAALLAHPAAPETAAMLRAARMSHAPVATRARTAAAAAMDTNAYGPSPVANRARTVAAARSVTPRLLEVRNARRDYPLPRRALFGPAPVLRVLDGVSLTIAPGESLGLVGASGCGKSTLARAILGLEPLQAGQISLGGAPLVPGDPRLQAVFQDPYGSFDPRQRVARLLAEPFFRAPPPAAEQRVRIAAALTEVGLVPEDAARFIHSFSGGQRQRIAIARALIARPALIVLDEAVSALDPVVRVQIIALLADLRARHRLAYLFISHDLTVLRRVTDRIAVMDAGRIVETGPTATILGFPVHRVTQALISAAPGFAPRPA